MPRRLVWIEESDILAAGGRLIAAGDPFVHDSTDAVRELFAAARDAHNILSWLNEKGHPEAGYGTHGAERVLKAALSKFPTKEPR